MEMGQQNLQDLMVMVLNLMETQHQLTHLMTMKKVHGLQLLLRVVEVRVLPIPVILTDSEPWSAVDGDVLCLNARAVQYMKRETHTHMRSHLILHLELMVAVGEAIAAICGGGFDLCAQRSP